MAPGAALKFVPLTVTAVPGGPAAGVNPVIVGTPGAATTKSWALDAVVPATATAILPVAAPAGTATVSVVSVAATTVPATPLNVTALVVGVVPKPVPVIVTRVPVGPESGANPAIVIGAGLTRRMATMLPAASCVYWTTFDAAWHRADDREARDDDTPPERAQALAKHRSTRRCGVVPCRAHCSRAPDTRISCRQTNVSSPVVR